MAKVEKDPFRCSECGWSSQKWVGRCGECQAWGSVEELAAPKKLSLVPGNVTSKATPIGDVDLSAAHARPTGVSELDRVLVSHHQVNHRLCCYQLFVLSQ